MNWQPIETAPKGDLMLVYSRERFWVAYRSPFNGIWWSEEGSRLEHPTHWAQLEPPR